MLSSSPSPYVGALCAITTFEGQANRARPASGVPKLCTPSRPPPTDHTLSAILSRCDMADYRAELWVDKFSFFLIYVRHGLIDILTSHSSIFRNWKRYSISAVRRNISRITNLHEECARCNFCLKISSTYQYGITVYFMPYGKPPSAVPASRPTKFSVFCGIHVLRRLSSSCRTSSNTNPSFCSMLRAWLFVLGVKTKAASSLPPPEHDALPAT